MPFAHLLSGLRARLIVLVLAAILPATLLLLVSTWEQRQGMVDKQRDGALTNARLIAGNQGALINSTEQLLAWIAQFPEVQSGDASACTRRLDQLLVSAKGVRGLLVADPQGNIICVAPRTPGAAVTSIATLPAFKRAVEQQSYAIGNVITGSVSGRPNLTFGLPVLDERGRLVKVIAAGMDVDGIHDTLSNVQLPNGATVAVLDANGTVLGYTPEHDLSSGAPPIDSTLLRAVLNNQLGSLETAGTDGVQRLYAYAPHLLNGRPALYAVVGYPTDTLYATADMQLRRNLVVMALFAALAMLAAWLAGDIMIVRRARSVMWAASRLRRGDLSARAGGPYGSGELSTLARDFDAMAGQFEQRQRERDQAMSELASSKNRFEMLVSAVSSIVWTSDREGRLSRQMPAWEAFTGQRWPAYDRNGGFDVVHPEDRKRLAQVWVEAIQSGTPVEAEYRLWHAPSGRYRHVAMRGLPMLDGQDRIMEWMGIIADIHERKQAEQDRQLLLDASDALRQTRDETEALSRLAALLAPARADWCTIAVVSDGGPLLRVAGDHNSVPLLKAIDSLECMRTGQVQLMDNVTPDIMAQLHGDVDLARQIETLHKHGLQQLMFAPVMFQGKPAGLIVLGITQAGRRFDDSIQALMSEVARRTALTLDNHRLYREERESRLRAERNADYLARLQDVSSALAVLSAPSDKQASEAILKALMRSFGAATGAISVVSVDGKTLELMCTQGYAPEVVETFERVVIDERVTAATEVVRTGEPVWVQDQASYLRRYPQVIAGFMRFNDHACAVVPMKLDNRVAGVIALNFDHAREFSAEDKDVLMTLSTQGAQAMARARLFEEERYSRQRAERSAHYLSRLQSVTSAMSSLSELSLKHLTDATLDALMQTFSASTGAISVVMTDGLRLEVISARGYTLEEVAGFKFLSIAEGVTAGTSVAASGEPVWIRNNEEYVQRYPDSRSVYQRGNDAACAVIPMKLQQQVLGVISLNFDHERDFSEEDKNLLMTLGTQCAQAMERVQLYEQAQQLNQQLEGRVQDRTRQLETTITQLRKSREQLRELSGQLLAAVEEERKRISQEVHDELGQALTVIKMDLGFARRKLNGAAPDVSEHLAESVKHIDETIRVMRRIATDLRPGILDSLGLEAAVDTLAQEFESRTGIQCSLLKQASDTPIFDKDISIAAYRIVQEALTNIARHAHASEAHITYVADDERLFIEIHDNGIGIARTPGAGTKSLGLRGMNERARHVHGTVSVQGEPGKGTTVTLEIPLPRPAGEAPASS